MLLEKLQEHKNFTAHEKDVAEYILSHLDQISELSVGELAKASYTSKATVVRLSQKLGLNGFQDLKITLTAEINQKKRIDQLLAKLLFSSSLSALMRTPKKSTREKRIGNRLPMIAICFSFIFSSVLSSLQGYGFSLWSAGSSGRSGSAEPLSCGLWCHSGVFPAIPLFLHSAYVLSV